MKKKIYIGIDIGKKGGVVILFPDGRVEKYVMPRVGTQIDQNKLWDIIEAAKLDCIEADVLVGMEDVHSIFGSGAKSNFEFGRALGLVEGMMAASALPFVKFSPKKWQKELFEGVPKQFKAGEKTAAGNDKVDTKAMAAIAVSRLYPSLDMRASARCKNVHDGVVDALLIAHYLKLKY